MADLRRRADEGELLDAGVPESEARASLADLRFVNRWLGNRRALLAALRPHLEAGNGRLRLLDVGCGSADVPAYVVRSLARPLLAVGLDLKLLHLRGAPPEVHCVAGDVTRLPFAPGAFDVVTASLFLHHFDARELPPLLRALYALSRRALIVNDLHRARVPYLFGRQRRRRPALDPARLPPARAGGGVRGGRDPGAHRAAFPLPAAGRGAPAFLNAGRWRRPANATWWWRAADPPASPPRCCCASAATTCCWSTRRASRATRSAARACRPRRGGCSA
jgi:SAM-dependent methyltransferase